MKTSTDIPNAVYVNAGGHDWRAKFNTGGWPDVQAVFATVIINENTPAEQYWSVAFAHMDEFIHSHIITTLLEDHSRFISPTVIAQALREQLAERDAAA